MAAWYDRRKLDRLSPDILGCAEHVISQAPTGRRAD
jgi:hypothetical protein